MGKTYRRNDENSYKHRKEYKESKNRKDAHRRNKTQYLEDSANARVYDDDEGTGGF